MKKCKWSYCELTHFVDAIFVAGHLVWQWNAPLQSLLALFVLGSTSLRCKRVLFWFLWHFQCLVVYIGSSKVTDHNTTCSLGSHLNARCNTVEKQGLSIGYSRRRLLQFGFTDDLRVFIWTVCRRRPASCAPRSQPVTGNYSLATSHFLRTHPLSAP